MLVLTEGEEWSTLQLRLSTFITNHERFAVEAAQNQHTYGRYLLALAEQEVVQREGRRRQRRMKEAKLPVVKELSDFEFAAIPGLNAQKIWLLAQGDYIRQREPVILVGNPGLGKSHIATALAVAACQQDYRVRFYNVAALVNELILAQQEQRLSKLLQVALHYDLIVLDELGFIPFSQSGAQLIFQFCSTLYERVALLVTTNLKFGDWTQVFGDERLTHRADFFICQEQISPSVFASSTRRMIAATLNKIGFTRRCFVDSLPKDRYDSNHSKGYVPCVCAELSRLYLSR